MARLLALLWVVAGGPPDAGTPPETVRVTGTAVRLHEEFPCRGGAAVTPDMIDRQRTPLAHQELTLYRGQQPTGTPAARLKTDRWAGFIAMLRPGRYCVMFGHHQAPDAGAAPAPAGPVSRGSNYDPQCMYELAHPTPRCDTQLDVPSEGASHVELVHYSANTCPQPWAHPCWRGPMPP